MTNQTSYDATRDPRTGRPILPIDADNTHKADAESLPLTDEDNQGIDFGDDESSTVGEEDDLPQELEADDAEDDDAAAPSSVDVNSTVPRMKAADPESEELESDNELIDDDLLDEATGDQETAEGERPEALAKFAEAARNGDGKPVRNGTEATAETAPIPTDLAQKQDAATRVLREGVLKQDQGADEAIDRLPDRTAPRDHLPQG
ncbi:MAG: hypothetical protein Q7T14_10780 [Aestuariivirga sp.]|nr:hypothetical protein [Aestuariivirga sp.]